MITIAIIDLWWGEAQRPKGEGTRRKGSQDTTCHDRLAGTVFFLGMLAIRQPTLDV